MFMRSVGKYNVLRKIASCQSSSSSLVLFLTKREENDIFAIQIRSAIYGDYCDLNLYRSRELSIDLENRRNSFEFEWKFTDKNNL